jgi:hypothetical protein
LEDGLLLGFYRGRKVTRRNLANKSLPLVRPVAEWRVCGVTAAAETQTGTPAQSKGFAGLINDLEVTFHAQRAIIVHGYFCCSQEFLQDFKKRRLPVERSQNKSPHLDPLR